MDQQEHGTFPPIEAAIGASQMAYGANLYQPTVPNPTSAALTQSAFQSVGSPLLQQQLAYQKIYQQQQQQLGKQLDSFWANQHNEVEKATDFKNHSLPLARIKKIMKADEDVKMISAEAPVVFARACEMFILELTLRAWNHTEENKRRTLQKSDIAAAITRTDIFDFLLDIVPREDPKDEALASIPGGRSMAVGGATVDAFPFCYTQPENASQAASPGTIMGSSVMEGGVYAQQPEAYMVQQMWPHQLQNSPSDH